jgi:nondiscriminating glutamyl-tRNA synthetase
LHLGTARTALYNYLYAKRHGGTFVLRLEDTDEERSKEEHTQDILAGLKWLGLTWDEGPDIGGPYPPYRQTEKEDHYQQVANKLIREVNAYFSYETPEELEALREEQKANNQASRYDNRGRDLSEEQAKRYQDEGRVPTIRFRVEEPRVVSWNDHVKGDIAIETDILGGDMVIVKSSGIAVYNFAVVVDDIDMKMTHVIRGEDHIMNTAKQILLYEALGAKLPEFAHVPLIFDLDRAKLSKRKHGEAVHVDSYRKNGYMPEAMVNYLTQMSFTLPDSWKPDDGRESPEIFSLEEACKMFDIDRLSTSPAVFDVQKLNWFNNHWIRRLPLSEVRKRAQALGFLPGSKEYSDEKLEEMIGAVRNGIQTLAQLPEVTDFFFAAKIEVPQDVRESVLGHDKAQIVLENTLKKLGQMPWGDHAGCKAVIDGIGKEFSVKGKELYWPLRAALSGRVQGPDLGSLLSVLGEKRVRERLESVLPCRSV